MNMCGTCSSRRCTVKNSSNAVTLDMVLVYIIAGLNVGHCMFAKLANRLRMKKWFDWTTTRKCNIRHIVIQVYRNMHAWQSLSMNNDQILIWSRSTQKLIWTWTFPPLVLVKYSNIPPVTDYTVSTLRHDLELFWWCEITVFIEQLCRRTLQNFI